jgi:hypothetical protein
MLPGKNAAVLFGTRRSRVPLFRHVLHFFSLISFRQVLALFGRKLRLGDGGGGPEREKAVPAAPHSKNPSVEFAFACSLGFCGD